MKEISQNKNKLKKTGKHKRERKHQKRRGENSSKRVKKNMKIVETEVAAQTMEETETT